MASADAHKILMVEYPRHHRARAPSESLEHSRVMLLAPTSKPFAPASHLVPALPQPRQMLRTRTPPLMSFSATLRSLRF